MISRIVLAVIAGLVVGLLCLLLGVILGALNIPVADAVGHWFRQWGWVLGVLAGLWFFFAGVPTWRP